MCRSRTSPSRLSSPTPSRVRLLSSDLHLEDQLSDAVPQSPPPFSTAKQIAQQTAQRAAFLVDQAIQEKQSIIVRAQGEAKSAELIGDAVKANKGFLSLRRLEAAVSSLCETPYPRRTPRFASVPYCRSFGLTRFAHLCLNFSSARHCDYPQQEQQQGHARLWIAPSRRYVLSPFGRRVLWVVRICAAG